jgi:hypothetical protein
MIDFDRGREFDAAELPERLLGWTASARAALGLDISLPGQNGAQRQRAAIATGSSMREIYADEVAATQRTFAAEGVTT